MTEQERLDAFHKDLNNDKGLKSKRQLVTYVSLVILAINLSGATIKEANTFLFKIEFIQPEGLNILLALTLFGCIVRYLNYSYKHTIKLSGFWKERFLSDPRVLGFHSDSDNYYGILSPLAQKIYDDNYDEYQSGTISNSYKEYISHWLPFSKTYSQYWYNKQYGDELGESFNIRKNIGLIKLFKLLKIEYIYRIEAYFRYPETLDLKAPLIIASFAYISILMKGKIPAFITFLG